MMRAATVALLVAAAFVVGVRWGTFVVGGSDSYCYVNQAEQWASAFDFAQGALRLHEADPLVLEAPWPNAEVTFAPVGHVPSAIVRGAIVPICPAGLSIVMAPVLALGGVRAVFYVVPFFGALLVWATYAAGARFGARIGIASALLVLCSPAFLYQVVQPMSDVPAAALWMAAVALATGTTPRAPLAAGLAVSGAVVMRPNLVPLAIPIGLFLLFRPERPSSDRVRSAALYAAGAAVGALCVAVIQQTIYGSPVQSGYGSGSLANLFSLEHVRPNAVRYFRWLTASHTPAWLLAALAPFVLPGAVSLLFVSLFLVNVASYLAYTVFEDWWYLRFLLPTIPLVLILLVAVVDSLCRRIRPAIAPAALTAVTLALAVLFVREAVARDAFRLQRFEQRFERAGTFVARRLPSNAIVITNWESGSVRFYGRRRTLTWDGLDPAWLDRAMAFLRARGFEPFLLFESAEEPVFRDRFRASPLGRLDWPPVAEIAGTVRLYRPGDRDRYFRGQAVATEYVP